MKPRIHSLFAQAACWVTVASISARAELVVGQTQINNGNVLPSPITAVAGDLLEASLSSSTGENATAAIRNGSTGTAQENSGTNPASVWNNGTTTYFLNTTARPNGYDIQEIRLFSGWTDRASQSYRIFYSVVGDASFQQLGGDVIANVGTTTASVMTRTYDTTGASILSGVDAIRFEFYDGPAALDGPGTVYREFDVTGWPTGAASAYWSGTVNGNWDDSTANFSGISFANFKAGGGVTAIFRDEDGSSNPVASSSITVAPAGVSIPFASFQNNSVNYTVNSQGGSGITGTSQVDKTGTGNVTLAGSHSYTGATNVNAGTLTLDTAWLSDSSMVSIAAGATLNLTHSAFDFVGGLRLNGETVADGTYSSSTPGGFISGTGKLVVFGGNAITWTGSTSNSWNNTANWNVPLVPNAAGRIASFALDLPAGETVVTLDSQITVGSVVLDDLGTVADGNLTLSAGTGGQLSIAGGGSINVADEAGILSVTADLTTTSSFTKSGAGKLLLTGTNSVGPDLRQGTLEVGGGNTTFINGLTVQSTLSVLGGTANINDARLNTLGLNPTTISVSGGILNVAFDSTEHSIGDTAATSLNLSGTGVMNVTGSLNLAVRGDTAVIASNTASFTGDVVNFGWQGNNLQLGVAELTISDDASFTVNDRLALNGQRNVTINLDGGTFTTPAFDRANPFGGGVVNLNFDGGTLKANGAAGLGSLNDFLFGVNNLTLEPGGATIDTNGFNIGISQYLTDAGLGGGIMKTGAGTLSIEGSADYTGDTSVSQGTLAFAMNSSNLGNIAVSDGATLRVEAINEVTPPLTSSSLSLGNGGATSLAFDFNQINLSEDTPLITTNQLAASGTVNVSIQNALSLPSGVYKLISYSSLSGSLANFPGSPFALGVRSNGTLSLAGNSLRLTVASDMPVWSGLDNGNWIAGSTGAAGNWKLSEAGTKTDYIQGDIVLFDDSVTSGTTNINLSQGDVSPAFTTFANDVKPYTLGSSGGYGISGTGTLTKTGSAPLVITNTNTFGGQTTIGEGATLALGDGTSGMDGTLDGTSEVVNNGTLAFNRFGTSTASHLISGSGSVVKSGPGIQILSAANTYFGGTTVAGGVLQTTTTAGAANTGLIELDGGTFEINLGALNDFLYYPTFELSSSSSLGNVGTGQINHSGPIFGNGNELNIVNGPSSKIYINGVIDDVTRINILSGALGFSMNDGTPGSRGTTIVNVADGASFWYYGINANPVTNDLIFNGGDGINSGGALYYEGGSSTAAPLTGNITLASGVTGVGTSNPGNSITLDGLLTGPGGIKVMQGNLVLNGANTYAGATLLEGGDLTVNGSSIPDGGDLVINTGVVRVTGTEVVGRLIIGGTQMLPGTYGASGSGAANIDDINFIGTGVVSVGSGGSAYDSWATSKGLTAANNGHDQDPEFDGITNALEFVLGGDPLASDPEILPDFSRDPANFIFTFSRTDESESEFGLAVQYGSNLVGWTDVPVGAASGGSVTVTENAASPDTVVVTIPTTNAVNGKLFARLKASK